MWNGLNMFFFKPNIFKKYIMQCEINIKKSTEMFYFFFSYKSLKSNIVKYISVQTTIFQVLSSHIWGMAMVLSSADYTHSFKKDNLLISKCGQLPVT